MTQQTQPRPISEQEFERFCTLLKTVNESLDEAKGCTAHLARLQMENEKEREVETVVITSDLLETILSQPGSTSVMSEGRLIVCLDISEPLRKRLVLCLQLIDHIQESK